LSTPGRAIIGDERHIVCPPRPAVAKAPAHATGQFGHNSKSDWAPESHMFARLSFIRAMKPDARSIELARGMGVALF